jgi:4'-phosphopantetheinyl transferase
MPATAEGAWAPGPDRPLLSDGAVHLWRADLAAVSEEVCELLCQEELARGERLLGERHRALWMRSRGVLRTLLGRYLAKDPRTLRFSIGTHGKPALLQGAAGASAGEPSPTTPISFNLSHSGQLALYAFTTGDPVGVDVEVARRTIDAVAVARRVFGAAEARRLAELDPTVREREFQRAWVRHEAELKCLGVGIAARGDASGARATWIAELEVGERASAAVAAVLAPRELLCWDWPPAGPRHEAVSGRAGA